MPPRRAERTAPARVILPPREGTMAIVAHAALDMPLLLAAASREDQRQPESARADTPSAASTRRERPGLRSPGQILLRAGGSA